MVGNINRVRKPYIKYLLKTLTLVQPLTTWLRPSVTTNIWTSFTKVLLAQGPFKFLFLLLKSGHRAEMHINVRWMQCTGELLLLWAFPHLEFWTKSFLNAASFFSPDFIWKSQHVVLFSFNSLDLALLFIIPTSNITSLRYQDVFKKRGQEDLTLQD